MAVPAEHLPSVLPLVHPKIHSARLMNKVGKGSNPDEEYYTH